MSAALVPPESYRNTSNVFLRWWPQISAILLVVVELCWILPWFNMVTQITQTAPLWLTGLVLGAIMLSAYALGVTIEALRLIKNVQLAGFGLLLIGSLFLAENLLLNQPVHGVASGLALLDPGAVLVLFFVIWMWWRGVSLSRGAIQPIIAWRRFELGLLLFMSYIFIAARVGYIVPGFVVFFLFLFSGLLAVVFARVSYVGIIKGVQKNPFDLRWAFSVVGILGATVVLAAIAGGMLSGQYRLLLDSLGEVVKLLIAIAIFILSIPGLLLSYVVGPILPWLKSIFSNPQTTLTPDNPIENLSTYFAPQQPPANLPVILQTLCFWGLILILVAALILRVRKTMAGTRRPDLDEPESLLEEGEARRLLRKALQDAMDNLAGRFHPARRIIVAARIRRIYSQLLELCAGLNQPRLEHQTPLEFLPEMGKIFTAHSDGLNIITLAYMRVRYGELPESKEEMDLIEIAWQDIQEEGRRLKRAGAGKLKTADVKEVERSTT